MLSTSVANAGGISLWRRAKITAGLSLVGAISGSFAGGLTAMFVVTVTEHSIRSFFDPLLFAVGAEFGAPLGAVLFPIAGWTLLRRVSFGRAFLGSVLGTLVGGVVGWLVPFGLNSIQRSMICGFLGFIAAVLIMRRAAKVDYTSHE
ncbi:MAG: hypothetical protein ABI852_05155 [Gemmatimonadaceae bacterium]